jgi:hypothetical protein
MKLYTMTLGELEELFLSRAQFARRYAYLATTEIDTEIRLAQAKVWEEAARVVSQIILS